MQPFTLFDGHLDLAYNAVHLQRDQTLPLDELRRREAGSNVADSRGTPTVTLPELRRAGAGAVMATLYTRCKPDDKPGAFVPRESGDFIEPRMTHADAMAQLAYYRALERAGEIRVIENKADLVNHLTVGVVAGSDGTRRQDACSTTKSGQKARSNMQDACAIITNRIGVIITIECADPIIEPEEIDHWLAAGVRGIGLAHYGAGRYASGTPMDKPEKPADGNGPLTELGVQLLMQMSKRRVPLDLTHLSDAGFDEAVRLFDGPVYASHSNCRALCDNARQLTDEQIKVIIERGGVIGAVLHNGMISNAWRIERESRRKADVTLGDVANHIDHICQLAGSAEHVALGSDLDGGFGSEACPAEIDTAADLPRLAPLLRDRGMSDDDLAGFFLGNWRRFWMQHLPQ